MSARCSAVSWSSGIAGRRTGPIFAAGFLLAAFLAGFFFAGMVNPWTARVVAGACLVEWRTHTLSHSPRRWPLAVATVEIRGGRLDCDETGRRGPQGATAALLRPDAVRPQDRRGRPHHRFRRRLSRDHRAGRERGGARSDPRRRGEDRRRHPQADVRAADALQLRGRRHHRRQSQRLLRARHPPRDAAALDRDPVRGRHDPAVRHRAAARHSRTRPTSRACRPTRPPASRRSPSSCARRRKTRTTTVRCFSSSTTCRATRSITPRPTRSATASTIRRSSRSASRKRCGRAQQAVKETVADPAFKNLHDLETGVIVDMFLTLARREGAQGDDRAVPAHAGAAAARAHRARAIWLRAQPRRQGAGGDRACSRR